MKINGPRIPSKLKAHTLAKHNNNGPTDLRITSQSRNCNATDRERHIGMARVEQLSKSSCGGWVWRRFLQTTSDGIDLQPNISCTTSPVQQPMSWKQPPAPQLLSQQPPWPGPSHGHCRMAAPSAAQSLPPPPPPPLLPQLPLLPDHRQRWRASDQDRCSNHGSPPASPGV